MAKYMLARYHRRMAEAKESLGGMCVFCGSTENLEIDHIDPTTKLFTLGSKLASVSETKYLIEIVKCQLLCHVCHMSKSISEAGKQRKAHGRYTMYRQGCRCDECKKANNDYQREWKRNRK